MEVTAIPKRIRQKFVDEILDMYGSGEISAGKASEMLGIPRAAFYQLLSEKRTPLPKKLKESIKKELKTLPKNSHFVGFRLRRLTQLVLVTLSVQVFFMA